MAAVSASPSAVDAKDYKAESPKKRKLDSISVDGETKIVADGKLDCVIDSLQQVEDDDLRAASPDKLETFFAVVDRVLSRKSLVVSKMLDRKLGRCLEEFLDFFSDLVEPEGVPKGEVTRCIKELMSKTKVVSENLSVRGPMSDCCHQDSGWDRVVSIAGINVTASCASCTMTAAGTRHYDDLVIKGHETLSSFRNKLKMPNFPLGVLLSYIVECVRPSCGFICERSEAYVGVPDWREEALSEWTKDVKENFAGYIQFYDSDDLPALPKRLIISHLVPQKEGQIGWVLVKANRLALADASQDPQFVRYQRKCSKKRGGMEAAAAEFETGACEDREEEDSD